MRLAGASALVTGGSRGIGRAVALELAGRGARVAVVARPSAELDATARELGTAAIEADLGDRDSVARIVGEAEAAIGTVDIVVNNAAVVRPTSAADLTDQRLQHELECNLIAPMRLVGHLLPGMLDRGRGHIVSVSSGAAALPLGNMSTYCASKAGLLHHTASLRSELWNTPVGTTVVELGTVRGTNAYEAALLDPTLRRLYGRLQRLGLMADTPADEVARRTADAIATGATYVRLPRAARPFWALNSVVRDVAAPVFRVRLDR